MDTPDKDQCPTCNSPVIIAGHTTKYFVPDVSKEKEDNIMLAARNVQLNQQIKEAKAKISELQSALRAIEDTVDNWRWGWDGDCGISEKIGVMVDKALAEQP